MIKILSAPLASIRSRLVVSTQPACTQGTALTFHFFSRDKQDRQSTSAFFDLLNYVPASCQNTEHLEHQ